MISIHPYTHLSYITYLLLYSHLELFKAISLVTNYHLN
nr:MAG TPA: hypothetical protein [Caudoviricetes sp.]